MNLELQLVIKAAGTPQSWLCHTNSSASAYYEASQVIFLETSSTCLENLQVLDIRTLNPFFISERATTKSMPIV